MSRQRKHWALKQVWCRYGDQRALWETTEDNRGIQGELSTPPQPDIPLKIEPLDCNNSTTKLNLSYSITWSEWEFLDLYATATESLAVCGQYSKGHVHNHHWRESF